MSNKTQYVNLLRLAQRQPDNDANSKRAHKEARAVVRVALAVQQEYYCNIGNTNLYDEVMSQIRNIVLCPSMIEGYCTHLNETLARGV